MLDHPFHQQAVGEHLLHQVGEHGSVTVGGQHSGHIVDEGMGGVDFQDLGHALEILIQHSHHPLHVARHRFRVDEAGGAFHQALGGIDRRHLFAQLFLEKSQHPFQCRFLQGGRATGGEFAFRLHRLQVGLVNGGELLAVVFLDVGHHKIVHLVVHVQHLQAVAAEELQVGVALDGLPGGAVEVEDFLLPLAHPGDIILEGGQVVLVGAD